MHTAHDLFLLTFNLAQMRDPKRVIQHFTGGLSKIGQPAVYKYSKRSDSRRKLQEEICTRDSSFGFIYTRADEHSIEGPLLQNAVGMLAVLLERLAHEKNLQEQKEHIESLAEERMSRINDYITELEKAKIASLNLVEDLKEKVEEKEKIAAELRESQKNLLMAGEVARIGGWQYHPGTEDYSWSEQLYKIYNVDPEHSRISVQKKFSLIFDDDRERVEHAFNRAVEKGLEYEIEFRITPADKKMYWIKEIGRVEKNDKGAVTLVFGANQDITGRKEAERALQQSAEDYKRLFNEALTGNYISDLKGRVILCNDTFAKMAGHDSPADVYTVPAQNFHPDSTSRKDLILALTNHKTLTMVENRMLRKDGRIITVLENIIGDFDENGRLQHIRGYALDITKRKAAEEALRYSEHKYRMLFDNSPIGILSIDTEGNIIEVNNRLLGILGSPSIEATKHINMFTFKPLIEAGISRVFRQCLSEGAAVDHEAEYVSKWDKKIYTSFHLVPIHDRSQQVASVLATVEDISSRKKAEQELQESYQQLKENQRASLNLMEDLSLEIEERRRAQEQLQEYAATLSSIFSAAPIGIGLIVDRTFLRINAAFCAITGYSEHDVIGKSARIVYPDEAEYKKVGDDKYSQILDRGTGTVETRWQRQDGGVIDILLSSTAIDKTDLTKGVIFTALDITERKTHEKKIQASLAEKEVMLKEIHHRVKNNLQIISSLLGIQAFKIDDPGINTIFVEMKDRIRSMAMVHERLYRSNDFSGIELKGYVESMKPVLLMANSRNQRVDIVLDIADIRLPIDKAVPCGLILNELASNCMKHAFTHSGSGKIVLGGRKLDKGRIQITVSDNGSGIPDSVDMSENSRSFGLQLVRILTDQLSGSLDIKTGSSGTTFTILFSP